MSLQSPHPGKGWGTQEHSLQGSVQLLERGALLAEPVLGAVGGGRAGAGAASGPGPRPRGRHELLDGAGGSPGIPAAAHPVHRGRGAAAQRRLHLPQPAQRLQQRRRRAPRAPRHGAVPPHIAVPPRPRRCPGTGPGPSPGRRRAPTAMTPETGRHGSGAALGGAGPSAREPAALPVAGPGALCPGTGGVQRPQHSRGSPPSPQTPTRASAGVPSPQCSEVRSPQPGLRYPQQPRSSVPSAQAPAGSHYRITPGSGALCPSPAITRWCQAQQGSHVLHPSQGTTKLPLRPLAPHQDGARVVQGVLSHQGNATHQ
uniref:Uncharacterized protein n=1 Tax=Zonotrichia albicollis TaxID=44394 RepID=A0A8D2QIM6_ZONAL